MKRDKSFSLNRKKGKVLNDKNSRQKGYDYQWEVYRRRFLHHNPLCYVCNAPATVVDHIVAHKGDKLKFRATNNHMPLCHFCHNYITARFDKFQTPKTEEKLQWINQERKINNITKGLVLLKDYEKKKR